MTCKDCLHYEACDLNDSLMMNESHSHLMPCDHCPTFKDRSRFVELPCKPGDTVYEIEWQPDHKTCYGCGHYAYSNLSMDSPSVCLLGKPNHHFRQARCMTIKRKTATLDDILHWVAHKMWNKCVCATQEEAKAAIANGMDLKGSDKQ